jgi:hypothetical protein
MIAVGEALDLRHVVGGEQDGGAAALRILFQLLPSPNRAVSGSSGRRRLVELHRAQAR